MSTYSGITRVSLDDMRIARYVIISPNPEDDVIAHMDHWAKDSGLLDYPEYEPRKIGWDFPYLSEEQKVVYKLRGYVSAYVIPEDFVPKCEGAEIVTLKADTYAKITITDPFSDPFTKIPNAYQLLMDYAKEHNIEPEDWDNRTCFEEVYEENGTTYMDVNVPVDL